MNALKFILALKNLWSDLPCIVFEKNLFKTMFLLKYYMCFALFYELTMYIVDNNNHIINFPVYEQTCCIASSSTIDTSHHTITWGVLPFLFMGEAILQALFGFLEAYKLF